MARTGFCDSKPLLDLHKKVDDRVPVRSWGNGCAPIDGWQSLGPDERLVVNVEVDVERKWGRPLSAQTRTDILLEFQEARRQCSVVDGSVVHPLYSLQALVPSLLRHEVEVALEKLGLIWDRTYAWDMFLDMMRTQMQTSPPSTDLPQHFTDATRAILVDWLIQVHDMMQFQAETLYLAVHLLNRCLRQMKVTTANLQLLGMVCLFLAAKKEECLLPEVSGLCYLMDHTYTKHQLLRMERKVLCGLKFDLSHCPPLHFLILFASIAHCSTKMVWMARYLLELSLVDGQCVAFLPVHLAGAALCLARQVLQEPPTPEGEAAWCLVSSLHIGSESVLLRIMSILASAAATAQTRDTCATYLKYSSADTMHVSRHPGLKNPSSLLGTHT